MNALIQKNATATGNRLRNLSIYASWQHPIPVYEVKLIPRTATENLEFDTQKEKVLLQTK